MIILIISALMNFWAVHMLIKCYVRVSDASKRATTYSYSAVMYELAGNRGVAVIEVILLLSVLGARMSGVQVSCRVKILQYLSVLACIGMAVLHFDRVRAQPHLSALCQIFLQ